MAWIFSILMWWTDQNTPKKQIGSDWDTNSNQVQAHAQQVTHFVANTYPSCDEWFEGTPQVVCWSFKCVEADVVLTWGLWPRNMPLVAKMKQYLPTVTMIVTFVEDYARGKEEEEVIVYGCDDDSKNHQSDNNQRDDM